MMWTDETPQETMLSMAINEIKTLTQTDDELSALASPPAAEVKPNCRLEGKVIKCVCGKPSAHYGTMGEIGAREVREVKP